MSFRPTSPTRPITPDCPRGKHHSKFGVWQKLQHFFGRDEAWRRMEVDDTNPWSKPSPENLPIQREMSSARPIGIGLPRQATFRRQNSEKRERLCPVDPLPHERRAFSTSRPGSAALTKFRSNSLPSPSMPGRRSAPAFGNTLALDGSNQPSYDVTPTEGDPSSNPEQPMEYERLRPPRPPSVTSSTNSFDDERDYFEDRTQLNRELDTKWILNLSMHFRDKSDREKFFVTFAETPSRWRRVTVSCDYRNAEPGSLEMDLRELQLQRDKSMQIYEAIRESLTEIKFYDTVTNLKLETREGRLHVHVTEDINEIIPYPPVAHLNHILQDTEARPKLIRESELSFEAHLSGFVYKVMYKGRPYIKKEIPGPDTVDEFLYEVNALHALQDSHHVIDLEAIITDETGEIIKGLLIQYGERGAIVDLLYDYKGEIGWDHRERWARHVIQGLSDIHEEGYVQGDFTLSNIVVDRNDNARIIDINRRGCPVGWEPPEIAKKIASNQRISMYISQKTDLYQLGMTLWALAMDDDEPERHDPPLSTQEFPAEVPLWYQDIVRDCLSLRPRDRSSATDLLKLFPPTLDGARHTSRHERPSVRIRTEKQYIDPAAAVERDDLERFGHGAQAQEEVLYSPESSREDYTFTWPQSSNYDRDYDSTSSEIGRTRGRARLSDHDLMLQAQRRSQQALTDEAPVDGASEGPTPIISISTDGTESHIIEIDNSSEMAPTGATTDDETVNMLELPSPILSPQLSDLHHLGDRTLFGVHSETSDNTPRNSSLQLFGPPADSLDQSTDVARADIIPDELAELGSHPNVSESSLEHIHFQPEEVSREQSISPLPALSFTDSGYNEPEAFGLDLDDDDRKIRRQSVKLQDHSEPKRSFHNTSQPCVTDERTEKSHMITTEDHQDASWEKHTTANDGPSEDEIVKSTAPPYVPRTAEPGSIIEVVTSSEPETSGTQDTNMTSSDPEHSSSIQFVPHTCD